MGGGSGQGCLDRLLEYASVVTLEDAVMGFLLSTLVERDDDSMAALTYVDIANPGSRTLVALHDLFPACLEIICLVS